MLPRWFQWFRPRRRWFQYRLRTLFVLMTLLCLLYNYNVWRQYQCEKAIVDGIIARDPQAIVHWSCPSWLGRLFNNSLPACFYRVDSVTIFAELDIPREIIELRLNELSSLECLDLQFMYNFYPMERIAEVLRVSTFLPDPSRFVLKSIRAYVANPTDIAANGIRGLARKAYWQSSLCDLSSRAPDEINFTKSCDPPYHYNYSNFVDYEEAVADLFASKHEDLRIEAAKCLWTGHSRWCARRVLAFAIQLSDASDAARQLKTQVKADLDPQRILSGLSVSPTDSNTRWWAWLAALRPSPEFVPRLIELVESRDVDPEAIYALGQSKDPRALPVLTKILTSDSFYLSKVARKTICDMHDPNAESYLLDALAKESSHMEPSNVADVCRTLGEIGTKRCLPVLRKIAADPKLEGTDVPEANKDAIRAIESRTKSRSDDGRKKP